MSRSCSESSAGHRRSVHGEFANRKRFRKLFLLFSRSTPSVLALAESLLAQTPDRLEILSLVSGQAASTIEKARLVGDLKRTNENLKRSQAALESSNRTLETRIAERTASLREEVKEKER